MRGLGIIRPHVSGTCKLIEKISWLVVGVLRPCNIDGHISVNLWWLYSAATLENEAAGIMTQYLTQSHYYDTQLTSPSLLLLMQSTRLGSDKFQFNKSLV